MGASYSCSVKAGIKQLVCFQNKTLGQMIDLVSEGNDQ